MAEMENEVDVTQVLDEQDVTQAEGSDEQSDSPDEISYEQALAWKKDSERLKKAEAKLVELKRAKKNEGTEKATDNSEAYTKLDASIDRLVAKEPDLDGLQDDIKAYVNKGLPMDEAVLLVKNKDKASANRQTLRSSSITNADAPAKHRPVFDRASLATMSQEKYNEAMRLVEKGEASIS